MFSKEQLNLILKGANVQDTFTINYKLAQFKKLKNISDDDFNNGFQFALNNLGIFSSYKDIISPPASSMLPLIQNTNDLEMMMIQMINRYLCKKNKISL